MCCFRSGAAKQIFRAFVVRTQRFIFIRSKNGYGISRHKFAIDESAHHRRLIFQVECGWS